MKTNTEYIIQLMHDKMNGNLTGQESRVLDNLIKTDESIRNIWLEHQQTIEIAKAYHFSNSLNLDTAWTKIQSKIANPVIVLKPASKKSTFLWAAASVVGIIGLFVLGSLFFKKSTSTTFSNTIAASSSISLQTANNPEIKIAGANNELTINLSKKVISDSKGNIINTSGWENEIITLHVPDGKRCTIHLSDATSVMLNADSELKFPLKWNTSLREVALIGEGYFNVTKNAHVPFIINANLVKVKVLGTVFNFKAYPEETSAVSLFSGHVLVKDVKTNDSAFLTPGQMLEIDPISNTKMTTSKLDTSLAIGWQKGIFYFKNERLENIAKMIERQYQMKVVFSNSSLKNIKLTGVIDISKPISLFIDLFTKVTPSIKYLSQNGTLYIYK